MRARWANWVAWAKWAVPALAVAALLVGACAAGGGGTGAGAGDSPQQMAPTAEGGGGDDAGGDVAKDTGGRSSGVVAPGAPNEAPASQAASNGQGGSAVKLVSLESRIIRNASVQLEIGKGRLDQTIQQANSVVVRHQGIFAGSKTSAPNDGPAQGIVMFRVPNTQFEQTMAELKKLGTYRGESSSSSDVTSEYVDTKSQLDAWRAQERVYLRLMSEAKTIGETLAVRARLDEVQSNINRLQGQLNVLEDQTSMATINLELNEPGAIPTTEPSNPFEQAWRTGVTGLLFMVKALIVALMWLAPPAIVLALVLLVVRALRRRPPVAPPAPPAPQAEA